MNDTTTTERQRRRRTILESEVKRVAKQVVRELGADASLSDVEKATRERLGLQFGQTRIHTLHEHCVAVRRRERRRERRRRQRTASNQTPYGGA